LPIRSAAIWWLGSQLAMHFSFAPYWDWITAAEPDLFD